MKSVADIPQELYDKIIVRFESDKNVRLLRTAQQEAQRKGDFLKALNIAKNIESLWTICLDNYMAQAEREVSKMSIDSKDLPQDDKQEMMEKLMVLFLCSDIVESAIIDMNDILHRTKPDTDITAFSDLQQALDIAKQKLKYLQQAGDYMEDLIWAEKCDNMYELMQSKARSIIRKRKESKDWGKNARKFINR